MLDLFDFDMDGRVSCEEKLIGLALISDVWDEIEAEKEGIGSVAMGVEDDGFSDGFEDEYSDGFEDELEDEYSDEFDAYAFDDDTDAEEW